MRPDFDFEDGSGLLFSDFRSAAGAIRHAEFALLVLFAPPSFISLIFSRSPQHPPPRTSAQSSGALL